MVLPITSSPLSAFVSVVPDAALLFPHAAKTSLQNDKDILSKPVMAAIQPRVDRLIWPGPAPSTVESSGTTAFQNVFQNGMSIDKALKEAQGQMDTDMKSSDFTSMESKYAYFDEHK